MKRLDTMLGGGKLKRVRLDAEGTALEVRVKSLQTGLLTKQVE